MQLVLPIAIFRVIFLLCKDQKSSDAKHEAFATIYMLVWRVQILLPCTDSTNRVLLMYPEFLEQEMPYHMSWFEGRVRSFQRSRSQHWDPSGFF